MVTKLKQNGARILTATEPRRSQRKIPLSLVRAAGLWKRRKIDAVAYQRKIRQEWERRLRQLERARRG